MITIDAHTHIFPPEIIADRTTYLARDAWFARLYADPRSRMASAEELVASLDCAQVDCAVTFGFAFRDNGLCALCNDYVLESAQKYPTKLVPFATVNPAQEGARALHLAQTALARGALGIGELMPAGQGFQLDDAQVLDPLMALARQVGIPVLMHVNEPLGHNYPGKTHIGPQEAYEMICRYPENKHILAHLGGGLPFYELMPEVKQNLANTYYDTAASPYLYAPDALAHLAGWVGSKLLWGTDYPLIPLPRCLRGVEGAKLNETQQRMLMSENLLRVLPNLRQTIRGE